MMLRGHLLVAAGGFLVIKYFTSEQPLAFDASTALQAICVLLGCLLPDIDSRHSTIGRRLPVLSWPITLVFGHRGVFHSLLASLPFLYFAHVLEFSWLHWLGVGYLLHLLGDYLTPSGIPLFYPLSRRYRFILVSDTGSFSENILALTILVFGIYLNFF